MNEPYALMLDGLYLFSWGLNAGIAYLLKEAPSIRFGAQGGSNCSASIPLKSSGSMNAGMAPRAGAILDKQIPFKNRQTVESLELH
jgi:hypothetical protein